jgi:hypothetical protein
VLGAEGAQNSPCGTSSAKKGPGTGAPRKYLFKTRAQVKKKLSRIESLKPKMPLNGNHRYNENLAAMLTIKYK